MASKEFKAVQLCLARHDYELDHVNAKGGQIFVKDGCKPVAVYPWIAGNAAMTLIRNIDRAAGGSSDRKASKRRPEQIKARQAADRERAAAEVERRTREVERLLAERDARMRRAGFVGSDSEFRLLLARIEQEERELAYWRGLMTEVPRNSNKVRHRS